MGFRPGEEVTLLIVGAAHHAAVTDVDGATIHLEIRSRDQFDASAAGTDAAVGLVRDGVQFFCWGKAWWLDAGRVRFITQTEILPERRRAGRSNAGFPPAAIREDRRFARALTDIYIVDVGPGGIRFRTAAPIETSVPYVLEFPKGLPGFRRQVPPVKIAIKRKRISLSKRGYAHVYGAVFSEQGETLAAILAALGVEPRAE